MLESGLDDSAVCLENIRADTQFGIEKMRLLSLGFEQLKHDEGVQKLRNL
jgi:hypothetical protein